MLARIPPESESSSKEYSPPQVSRSDDAESLAHTTSSPRKRPSSRLRYTRLLAPCSRARRTEHALGRVLGRRRCRPLLCPAPAHAWLGGARHELPRDSAALMVRINGSHVNGTHSLVECVDPTLRTDESHPRRAT